MDNKVHFLAFRREVEDLLSTGTLKNDVDAIIYALKHGQVNEIRMRTDKFLTEHDTWGSDKLLYKAIFSQGSQIADPSMDLFCQSIGYGAMHRVINGLQANKTENFDSSRIEQFLLVLSNTDFEKKAQEDTDFGHKFSREKVNLYYLAHLAAINVRTVERPICEAVERIYNGLRLNGFFWEQHLRLSLNLDGLLNDKSDYKQFIPNMTEMLKFTSDMRVSRSDRLIDAFSQSLRLDKVAKGSSCSQDVLENIEYAQKKVAEHVLQALSGKPIEAMELFGSRTDDHGRAIPAQMSVTVGFINDSSLPDKTKDDLCMGIVRVALEAKTKKMYTRSIGDLIEKSRRHLDFEILVGSLKKRGRDNLLECAFDKSDFIHLLSKGQRARGLDLDLGL